MTATKFIRLQIAHSIPLAALFLYRMIDAIGDRDLIWTILAGTVTISTLMWLGFAISCAFDKPPHPDREGRLAEFLAEVDGQIVAFLSDERVEAHYRSQAAMVLPMLRFGIQSYGEPEQQLSRS